MTKLEHQYYIRLCVNTLMSNSLRIERHRRKTDARTLLIEHGVAIVLLHDHLAIGLLYGLPHFRLRHDLAHQILDGRLRVQVEQIDERVIETVRRVRLRWVLGALLLMLQLLTIGSSLSHRRRMWLQRRRHELLSNGGAHVGIGTFATAT